MADNSLSHLFEDTVQITTEALTCRLDPGETEVQEPQGNVLLGKLICKGKLERKAIAGTLKKPGWSWKEDDAGIIHFSFANNEDAWNVLNRRPWIICGALLVIMPWPSWLAPSEVKFDKSLFWVRLSGIPPFYWNKTNLEELAAKVSAVYKLPRYIDFERGSFGMGTLRFKATIEIDKPIFSGFFMKRESIKDLWVQYKYEKLPKFCQKCGIIAHEQKLCFKPPTVIKDAKGASTAVEPENDSSSGVPSNTVQAADKREGHEPGSDAVIQNDTSYNGQFISPSAQDQPEIDTSRVNGTPNLSKESNEMDSKSTLDLGSSSSGPSKFNPYTSLLGS
ncbi:hypothetical protein G4B88_030074 [Cannabis sativa]|uniref:Zinc knuckle CX2CX4HX4C domain-containing protein n=1 Tax=Cannabis sativa TaxID=3483 RepID=A0A7J6FSM1_CANSA|nr:hypothetical protein G4B88_030074 [Cannabis sativa]